MTTAEYLELANRYQLQIFVRPEIVFARGEGAHVYDTDGRRYLDFVAGIAVNAFGYGDPDIVRAIQEGAAKLIHISNLYHTAEQAELARALAEASFADRVFVCNSGTEAVDAAIKFVRKWARTDGNPDRYEIIAFENSFHGRTYGALSATGQSKLHQGFEPMLPGFHIVPFNDLGAVRDVLSDRTCAILVEPIQAEGGIHVGKPDFLTGLRRLADEAGCALIFDEIQTGMRRTGPLFTYEAYGVEPDVMTLAKPLAGGLPLAAVLMRQRVADALGPSDHGTTFGGGPLTCAVALTVLRKLQEPAMAEHVEAVGQHLFGRVESLRERHATLKEVRGRGLLCGMELACEAKVMVNALFERSILATSAGANILRFVPPLTVTAEQVDEVVDALDAALTHHESGHA